MNRFLASILLIVAASIALAQLPQNSYVRKRIDNVQELIRHVQSDPVVRSRYARHFAMTSEELYSYFSRLKVTRLQESGDYTVFSVPKTGELRTVKRRLNKGEPVFIDEDGNPVIMVRCGNPLGLGPRQPFVSPDVESRPIAGPAGDLVPMSVEVAPGVPADMMAQAMPPDLTPIPIVAVTPPPPVVTTGESPAPIISPLLGVLPALFLITNPGGEGVVPIPEPGTWLTLSLGGLYLANRARKKRQSKASR